jgi:gamma-glutamylcysteine synthetase
MMEDVEMDNGKLIGLESELTITDGPGRIVYGADDVLHHSNATDNMVSECSFAIVEVISLPASNLVDLETGFRSELDGLSSIVESLGLRAMPISTVGPEQVQAYRDDFLRYVFTKQILGKEKFSFFLSVCGTHLHIDREPEPDVIAQYNLLQSLDPVFVFLSSSSFLMGTNSLNCNRVNSYRNQVFGGNLRLYGQLLDYAESLDQLNLLGDTRASTWLQMVNDERAIDYFNRHNCCWGPIRLRKKTIEVRNSDANLFSLVMAEAALYKGVNNYVFDNKLGVKIAGSGETYGITDSEITLPPYMALKQMESEGIKDGLKSDNVFKYLTYLVGIAEEGLPYHERRYLAPFKEMLRVRKNVADLLYMRAKGFDPSVNGSISPGTAQMVSLYMDSLNRKDRTHPFTDLFPDALERAEHSFISR